MTSPSGKTSSIYVRNNQGPESSIYLSRLHRQSRNLAEIEAKHLFRRVLLGSKEAGSFSSLPPQPALPSSELLSTHALWANLCLVTNWDRVSAPRLVIRLSKCPNPRSYETSWCCSAIFFVIPPPVAWRGDTPRLVRLHLVLSKSPSWCNGQGVGMGEGREIGQGERWDIPWLPGQLFGRAPWTDSNILKYWKDCWEQPQKEILYTRSYLPAHKVNSLP